MQRGLQDMHSIKLNWFIGYKKITVYLRGDKSHPFNYFNKALND